MWWSDVGSVTDLCFAAAFQSADALHWVYFGWVFQNSNSICYMEKSRIFGVVLSIILICEGISAAGASFAVTVPTPKSGMFWYTKWFFEGISVASGAALVSLGVVMLVSAIGMYNVLITVGWSVSVVFCIGDVVGICYFFMRLREFFTMSPEKAGPFEASVWCSALAHSHTVRVLRVAWHCIQQGTVQQHSWGLLPDDVAHCKRRVQRPCRAHDVRRHAHRL